MICKEKIRFGDDYQNEYKKMLRIGYDIRKLT